METLYFGLKRINETINYLSEDNKSGGGGGGGVGQWGGERG